MPGQLILREGLRIVDESRDENYIFSDLNSIQVDDMGNIYALDSKDNKVKVYDGNGKHQAIFRDSFCGQEK